MGSGSFSPFHQFEVKQMFKLNIAGFDFLFTNLTCIAFTCIAFITILFFIGSRLQNGMIPNKVVSCFEIVHSLIANMVTQMIGSHYATEFDRRIIFTLFIFILTMNITGLLPFCFTVTSSIVVTFFMAFIVFLICVGISIAKRGWRFFGMFIPKGTPVILIPLMFVLEMFSYLARPISLSVRLAANMVAGHVMLDVIAYFTIIMSFFGFLPFFFLVILQVFEIGIAILQAYIFSILACVYIGESRHH